MKKLYDLQTNRSTTVDGAHAAEIKKQNTMKTSITVNAPTSLSNHPTRKPGIIRKFFAIVTILIAFSMTPMTSFAGSVEAINVAAQNGSLTYGIAGSVTFTVSFTKSGANNTTISGLSVTSGLPTGASASWSATSSSGSNPPPVTLTITTSAITPAGSFQFTVTSTSPSLSKTGTLTITKKTLTVSGATASNKVYDGTVSAIITGTLNGVINSDDVTLIGTGTFANKNIGTKSVTSTSTLGGTKAGNYSLTQPTGLSAEITVRPISVVANTDSRAYNGTISSIVAPTVPALQTGDAIGTSPTQTYDTKDVGTNKTLTASGLVINDGNGGNNYSISYPPNTTGEITTSPLSVTANNATMEFDGVTSYSGGNGVTFDGFVNSENQSVLGGTLAYNGSSQGAVNIGTYAITPEGYTATNYAITFFDGTLTITAPGSVTWNGNTSTNWGTESNWTPSAIPVAETSVTIPNVDNDPIISSTTAAECNDLTIASGATLTINSDASNSGSLIAHGATSGDVTYNRYMTGGRWYITSAPVYVTSGFDANTSKIVQHTTDYDFATYIESGNSGWHYETSIPQGLTKGEGYLVTLSSDNSLAFTGALNGDFTKSLTSTSADDGWHAVGNPYTSAIGITSSAATTQNFLTANSGILSAPYAAIYVWNETLNGFSGTEQFYKVIGNSGYAPDGGALAQLEDNYVQAGQGFLINITDPSTTPSYPYTASISFNRSMQANNQTSLTLKSAETSWPGITLVAEANGKTRSTVVAFNDQMTTGLDVTYDAGLLASDNFQVYTHLADGNNDVDFAIQCLPENQYSQLSVPVGVDLPEGGDLVFKASGVILRDGLFPVIEDRLLGIQTALKTATDSYSVTLDQNTSGIGRFYLSVADVTTSKPVIRQENKYTASLVNNRIILNGAVEAGTKATLYDICGRKVGEYPLAKMNRNEIPVSGLSQRVYLLKVEGSNYRQVIKLLAINY